MLKRLLFPALLWLSVASASAAPAFVQGKIGADNQSGTTVTVTLTSNAVAGHAILGCVVGFYSGGQPTLTISDGTNTYNVLDIGSDGDQLAVHASFYKENISGTPSTITITSSSSLTFSRAIADEFSGVATSSALDQHKGQTQLSAGNGTDAMTSGNTSGSASSGDLIYGCQSATTTQGTASVAGTNFTFLETDSGSPAVQQASEWRVLGSSATVPATFSSTNAPTEVSTYVIALKASGVVAKPHWPLGTGAD